MRWICWSLCDHWHLNSFDYWDLELNSTESIEFNEGIRRLWSLPNSQLRLYNGNWLLGNIAKIRQIVGKLSCWAGSSYSTWRMYAPVPMAWLYIKEKCEVKMTADIELMVLLSVSPFCMLGSGSEMKSLINLGTIIIMRWHLCNRRLRFSFSAKDVMWIFRSKQKHWHHKPTSLFVTLSWEINRVFASLKWALQLYSLNWQAP